MKIYIYYLAKDKKTLRNATMSEDMFQIVDMKVGFMIWLGKNY